MLKLGKAPHPALVAWYRLLGDAHDWSGRSNDGVVTGATATPWGYFFSGTNNNINFGAPSEFDFGVNQDFTVSLRMKTSTAATQYVCTKGSINNAPGAATTGFGIFMGSSSQYTAKIQDDTGFNTAVSAANQHDGFEHCITATFDRDGDLILYKDGVFIDSSDISSIGDIDTTKDLYLGEYSPPGGSDFTGDISELWIYNQALTQREIQEETRRLKSSLKLAA